MTLINNSPDITTYLYLYDSDDVTRSLNSQVGKRIGEFMSD